MEKKVCEECGRKFNTEEALMQHKQAKHSEKTKRRNLRKPYIAAGVTLVIIIAVGLIFTSMAEYKPKEYAPHIKGSENASVEIIEFSDFQCKFCKAAAPTARSVVDSLGGKVKLVYRHFPLQFHEFSRKAAEASECAADIGGNEKFWEYHDKLFENQEKLYVPKLKQYAAEIGLNITKFSTCLDSGAMSSRVQKDLDDGKGLGVKGTPTFFINGEMLSGNQPFSAFHEIIVRKL